ncbi:helix-turn-helix transcriptional regulator [Tardiphaga sp. 813_E8_N1_3]|uniref:helix-turn-helix transcriptional regulator n=1 Tax=Tardiphaga sp. 813_E8_N1_3 TaxID=3240760 RepID=UPI003F259D89
MIKDVAADPLLTVGECCKILKCSEPTLWRWAGNGTVPKPVKLGKFRRWPKSEILEVIEKAKTARHVVA